VDVSYLALSDDGGENPIESTIANLQQLGLTWERSLFSTGGVIDLSKIFWILMVWRWKCSIAKLLTPSNHYHTLSLKAGYDIGNPVSFPHCPPLLHIVPWIQASTLDKESAFLSYILFYFPKVAFFLHALTLSEYQCHLIQSPSLMALLPK